MNTEREIKVRDAIKYCIENFDSQTAANRIVEFLKDELKLQEQQCSISNVVGRSERLFLCDVCGQENSGKKFSVVDENWNKQTGLKQCEDCFKEGVE